VLRRFQGTSTAFRVVELLTRDGNVVAAAPDTGAFTPAGRAWFTETIEGSGNTSPRYRAADTTRWVVAEPVRDTTGVVVGVIAGDIEPHSLDAVLSPTNIRDGRLLVVDGDRAVVASRGASKVEVPAHTKAASLGAGEGPVGSAHTIAGVAPARAEGFGVIAIQARARLMRPVTDLRRTAIGVLSCALVLFVVFGMLFGRGEASRMDRHGASPA